MEMKLTNLFRSTVNSCIECKVYLVPEQSRGVSSAIRVPEHGGGVSRMAQQLPIPQKLQMKYLLIIAYSLLCFSESHAQLKCKTLKGKFGDSTTCFHSNGKVSTIDFAGAEADRYRHFIAFDYKGNEMYKNEHGCRHGCGSLDIKYFPNGSIQSARKTFQPDGGIQHYDNTTFFKEDGTFSHEEDNSWDTLHERIQVVPIENPNPPRKELKSETKLMDSLICIVKNTNSYKVELLVANPGNSKKKVIKIKKHQEIILGKYLPANGKEDPLLYFDVDIIPSKKLKRTYFILQIDVKSGTNRYLYIVPAPIPNF